MDYLCQTGHYFGLASKKTTASEPKPLFGGGYICQRTRKFDQRRETARENWSRSRHWSR
jgi:hypothetical protein